MTRASSCRSQISSVARSLGAGLLLAVACLGAWSPRAETLPPVRYNGELRINSRAIKLDRGDQTYLLGSTLRLNMDSFIWKPWFASIGGGFDVSRIHGFAETDSQTQVLGGHASMTLFPVSRFPTFGFINVTDTRSDVEASEIPERQVRITRFGLTQRYQPESGRASFSGRIDRSIEEGTEDGQRAVIDRGVFSGLVVTERQRFNGDLNITRLSRDLNQEELFEVVGTLRHNARPADTVVVDSFATYTDIRSDSLLTNFLNRTFQANSLAVWRPRRVPMTMSGSARVTANQRESDGIGEDTTTGNLAVGGDYLINRLTRLSGNVSVNYTEENVSSNQGAILSFNPDPLALGSFTYNWFTSTSVSNDVGNPSGDRTIFGALFGHGVSRARPFASAPAWSLSLAGNNNISGSWDSVNGAAATLGLNGSAGVSHTRTRGSTTVRLDAIDSHTFGASRAFATGDNNFQNVNFNLIHRQELSASSQWNASVSTGWNRQDVAGDVTITKFSNMNVGYTNSRLFGVPRMLFRSQFSARTIDLFFADLVQEENTDMRWENRVDYNIGKLETRLTATWNRVNARNGYSVLLTITRRFDGVF
jgi:hypothetical protein